MNRIYLQCCLTLGLTLATVFAYPQGDSGSRQPNIVFIFADDLGIGDTSVYGSEVIHTPHIDALAANGVRFTQGYVSHPVCSPSRAGMMTGRYQQRHGWEFNPAGRDVDHGLDIGQLTLANALQERGYATGMVGKWHLGQQPEHHPMSRGFDEYFGVLAGGSQFLETLPEGAAFARNGAPTQRSDYNAVYRGRERVQVDDYLVDVFTDEAISFIDRHADQPFFLYLSHTTPHTPLQATKPYLDRYGHVQNLATRVYAAMVAALDDSVGAVVAKLKEIGQYENTLIAFLSDNGCAGYIGNACSNLDFSGFKRYHQEGGVRVPFLLSWPDTLPDGMIYERPVISLDLMSTFTAAAGDMLATEDSVNLLPYLTGQQRGDPHRLLYWRAGPTQAIRDQRWKMIKYKLTDFDASDLNSTGRLDPPPDGWAADAPLGLITLLYDLQNDPQESRNVAAQYPDVVERLEAEYGQWDAQLPHPADAILPAIRSTLTDVDGKTVQLIF
jgi:arylsulfatase A-like enzyme